MRVDVARPVDAVGLQEIDERLALEEDGLDPHALVLQRRHDVVAASVELCRPLAHPRQRSRLQAHPDAECVHGS